ncbi:MAG: GNAT family N-acetyltransferase [Acidobacteriota bacterium]
MPNLSLEPLAQADNRRLSALMDEEERTWRVELDWDYSPIRRILASFLERRALPGYAAWDQGRAVGYTYFLIQKDRGIIGAAYACRPQVQEAGDRLLTLAIQSLQESRNIRRIEAQIIPLNEMEVTPVFRRHAFECFDREYLELDLATFRPEGDDPPVSRLIPWDSAYLPDAARVAFRSYRNEVDALISEDYGSPEGCESYLRSLVEHPGCGIFLPRASSICLDSRGAPCGFIICSSISSQSGMIAQISIDPAHQGLGVGTLLIRRTMRQLTAAGCRKARLTVSRGNRRALGWYLRLGFSVRRSFGAYVWLRQAEAMD